MPGKVNPVIPEVVLQVAAQVIGNDTAITIGGTQGNFELNVRVPLIARNLLDSIKLLTSDLRAIFAEKCVDGIQANEEGAERSAESTLAAATALNPVHRLRQGRRDRQGGGASRAGRCARSRSRRASTRRPTTRRWTCARWRRGTWNRGLYLAGRAQVALCIAWRQAPGLAIHSAPRTQPSRQSPLYIATVSAPSSSEIATSIE